MHIKLLFGASGAFSLDTFFVLAADLAGSCHETFEVLGSNFMDVIRKQRVREARKKTNTHPQEEAFLDVEIDPFKG